jgi:hypothetical protein
MTSIARLIALPIVSAGIIGGAALGLAGMANAQTVGGQEPTGPGYSFSPQTHAHPAPTVKPGWHNNPGPAYIAHITGQDQA